MKILISHTNQFNKGMPDEYQPLTETSLGKERFAFQ